MDNRIVYVHTDYHGNISRIEHDGITMYEFEFPEIFRAVRAWRESKIDMLLPVYMKKLGF
jgi:hypothetical protein